MKIYSIVVILLVLTGCATNPPIVKDRIIYKTVEVSVPVPCIVDVKCEFSGNGYTPTKKLLECIVMQKRALEFCMQIGVSE